MYDTEAWRQLMCKKKKQQVTEMKMLRWMCRLTRREKVGSGRIKRSIKMGLLAEETMLFIL